MGNSRKIICENRNLRKRSRKNTKGGIVGTQIQERINNLTKAAAAATENPAAARPLGRGAREAASTVALDLIYVCCLIDSEVAKKITQARKNSIIYLNCNPYNTFGFGWRSNTWGDTLYYGGKELYKLFGPEGTDIITSSSTPEATFAFCTEIISLLERQNIYVIDTADFDIKPILIGSDGGSWYTENLDITYPSVIENKALAAFENIQTTFPELDSTISEEFKKIVRYYKENFINLNDAIRNESFSERRRKHLEVLEEAVNQNILQPDIQKCLHSVLKGFTAVNDKNEFLGGKSSVELMIQNNVPIEIAGKVMMEWQKWESGVYYGPRSPPLLHDFVGFLFACANGNSSELIGIDDVPPKLSVKKLQEIILNEAYAQATEPPVTGSPSEELTKNRQRNGMINIIKNIKKKYPNLQTCTVYLDGESDDLLTAMAACKGLKDTDININIVFQVSVLHDPHTVSVPDGAINYKKKIGVTFNKANAIDEMMKKYLTNVDRLTSYLISINNKLNFSRIECVGLLQKVKRYKGYISEAKAMDDGKIALFNAPPNADGEVLDIKQESFKNVMANVLKVILAIDELLHLANNPTVGGKSRKTKRRTHTKRRPTKKRRSTKRIRPTKRIRHTKRRR